MVTYFVPPPLVVIPWVRTPRGALLLSHHSPGTHDRSKGRPCTPRTPGDLRVAGAALYRRPNGSTGT